MENLKDLELILEQHVEQVREAHFFSFSLSRAQTFILHFPFYLFFQFEPGMLGCVLLTVSAVLSRSIQKYFFKNIFYAEQSSWNQTVKQL